MDNHRNIMVLLPSSEKLKQNFFRNILLFLLNTILISCTSQGKPPFLATPSIMVTPLVSPSSAISTTINNLPSPIPTNTAPSIASANDIIATGSIHSISVDSITQEAATNAQMAIDDHYIYLVGMGGARDDSLFRIPFDGGKPEKIAISKYIGGHLNLIITAGNWIILVDTPSQGPNEQGPPSRWMMRAIDLRDLWERLLAESGADSPVNLAWGSNLAVDGDNLYWTTGAPGSGLLNEDVISMMDLNTGKTVVLTRTKADGSYWSVLGASEGRLVAERFSDENQGRKSNIFLFDPPGGQPQTLSTDGVSYLLQFVYPWVLFRAGSQNQTPDVISIYNLQTTQTRSIVRPGTDNSEPQMDGTRIYWSGATEKDMLIYHAINILDLTTDTIYVLPSTEKNVLFPEIGIHGNLIAWIREVNSDTNLPTLYLEWTTIK